MRDRIAQLDVPAELGHAALRYGEEGFVAMWRWLLVKACYKAQGVRSIAVAGGEYTHLV